MRKCILILLLFFLGSQPFILFSQSTDKDHYWQQLQTAGHDTARVLALLDYGDQFFNINYDSTEYYFVKAGELAKKINFKRGYHRYISYMAALYNISGQFEKNLLLCRHGYDLAKTQGDFKSQGVHLSNIANSFLYTGNNDSAAWYLVTASRYFEQSRDTMILGQVYGNLTTVFVNLKQYEKSLYYNHLALRIAKATSDKAGIGYALVNLGSTHKRMSHFDSADFYFNLAYPIAEEVKIADLQISTGINMGLMAIKKNRFEEADSYLKTAIKLSESINHDYGIVSAKKGLANSYFNQKKYNESIKELKEAIDLAQKNNLASEMAELYKMLYEAARANKNYYMAMDAFQKHVQLQDSIANIDIQKNIALLEKQYQTERKEKMLLQKDSQIKTQQLQIQTKNTWIWVLTSLVILSMLIGFLVWSIYKQKKIAQARQQQLKEMQLSMQAKEEERHRIARELHDDLGGTLSGIVVQSHFMSQQVEHHNVTALQKSIEKISHASSEMITKLNDIIWLVNPRYDTLEKLVQRIEEFANDMARAKGMDVRIDTIEEEEPLELNTQARKNIYLICKEAINNAVKYSHASELYLSVARSGADLKLMIEDNGRGFDAGNTRMGNGLANMKERASTIGATYSIDAENKKGTRVSLHYKIPQ